LENTRLIASKKAYATARELFQDAGYGLTEIVIDASRCGVPQRRERFFCVGHLGGEDGFLTEELTQGQTADRMTVRNYLGDALGIDHYYRHPRRYDRRAVFSIDAPAPTMRGTNRSPAPGYRGHDGDSASPRDVRALTHLERSLIQTFPVGWIWNGTKTNVEQMIANAVPPLLAAYVAQRIMTYARRNGVCGAQPLPQTLAA
jgi:DNA (cytosine-5)-methyltransferase 1